MGRFRKLDIGDYRNFTMPSHEDLSEAHDLLESIAKTILNMIEGGVCLIVPGDDSYGELATKDSDLAYHLKSIEEIVVFTNHPGNEKEGKTK